MAEDDQAQHLATPAPERQPCSLPQGYRQGIITAITPLLGFSLTFFRFWGFEVPLPQPGRALPSTQGEGRPLAGPARRTPDCSWGCTPEGTVHNSV